MKLPVLSQSVEDQIRDDVVPLRLSFSVLRVRVPTRPSGCSCRCYSPAKPT